MSSVKMKFGKLQTKPLKLFLGLALIFAVVAITILLMKVTLPDAFTYCAPDANHILPRIILLLIAIAGICATLIIRMENSDATILAHIVAIFVITVAFFIISSLRPYYSYNTDRKLWLKTSMLGFPLSEIEIDPMHPENTKHVNYFGNVLLIDKNGSDCCSYSSPVLYLPDGSKKTFNKIVLEPGEHNEIARYNEKKDQKLGVIGSDLKIIVAPNTYNFAIPISTGECYKYILAENENSKYGLLNSKGKIVIPFEYDLLNTGFDWMNSFTSFLKGGYMYAIKSEGDNLFDIKDEDIMLVDTLNNLLSFEDYQKKFPNAQLPSKGYIRYKISPGFDFGELEIMCEEMP